MNFDLTEAEIAWRKELRTFFEAAFTPEMRRLYAEVADRAWFVAISEAQRRHMPELRYAGVVHNGIDLDRYPLREDKENFVLTGLPSNGSWMEALMLRS